MEVNSTGSRVKSTVYALTAAVIAGFSALLWHSLLVTSLDEIEYSELDIIALAVNAVIAVLVIPVIWLGYRAPRLVHIAAIAMLSSSIATLAVLFLMEAARFHSNFSLLYAVTVGSIGTFAALVLLHLWRGIQ
ncbi:hypothetical protein ACQP1G_43825 [Nocardia sp. CA-107356]|uniref:hypothetical protein n=1 Tax=Nocardia sp. CA-107356 TaxID=3239972 RepID=UPI003D8F682A